MSEIKEIIAKSCLSIPDVSCYDVARDFTGPVVTALIAFFTVKFAFNQIAKQHQNTLDAQNQESKRNTKIELFKELNTLLDQVSATVREVGTYCMVKKYSNNEMKYEINHAEYLSLSGKLNQALLAVVSKIESHEIVNLKLFRAFRFSLQSIVYDIMKMEFEKDRSKVTEMFIEYTDEAQCYLGDFQVCMQNLSYSDVFGTHVPHRVPIDKSRKVITNNPSDLDDLLEYFSKETNWGKNNNKYEQEAIETYRS
ncbi:MAG: hypothetical protein KAT90_01975 [Gammaproteobacteria bacterium]|nr:hypothetical protein [Gammaproteobacteria bacterium]